MMKGIVYCFESPSNKKYIGITTNPESRYAEHRRHSKRLNTAFYRAVRKYGFENFEYEILEEVFAEDKKALWERLVILEKEYIVKLDTQNPSHGYNCTKGGDGVIGYKFTPEQLQKLSRSLKGKLVGPKNPRFGKVGTFKGKKHTDETKRKISLKHSGKTLSENHKEKIRISSTGRKHTTESKNKMSLIQKELHAKQVFCVELNVTFDSVQDASEATNVCRSDIRKVCNGTRIQAKGFTFRWFKDGAVAEVFVSNKSKKPIKCIETGKVFESISQCCDEMNLKHQHVSAVLNGRQKTTKGYTFVFA